ncbi:EF-hand domain-containing protein [Actibacterium sp. XHP0104]|uniref:EF-hand domain-containing protein n=1 Tax=Actibacterium sp. XHP0104 TaxID=2984335 RepID=UPI0021E76272|nr:EF-hand domain-containing protein [Actibacterium sp. XHP0104]MCV2881391.1 EF-hand domain-containing protein [Actibacterium sp. XHP0104]
MTRKTILTTLSVLALGGAAAVTALPAMASGPKGGQMGAMMMQRFDADNDGKITREEFLTPMQDRFAASDSDGDGVLSAEELASARPMGMQGGDMECERGERMGRGYDDDDDDYGRKHMKHMRDHARMTPEDRADRAQRMIAMMDADGDGALSAEELSAGPNAERAFSRLDADGDGNVTLEEFKAAKRPAAQ